MTDMKPAALQLGFRVFFVSGLNREDTCQSGSRLLSPIVSRFVKYTGYGNAAGLLASRGLLNGRRNSFDSQYAVHYSSDSDSDTEEYREAKSKINLVTGRVEAEQPDPMEGMTEEEKEVEAHRLIGMINRLSR